MACVVGMATDLSEGIDGEKCSLPCTWKAVVRWRNRLPVSIETSNWTSMVKAEHSKRRWYFGLRKVYTGPELQAMLEWRYYRALTNLILFATAYKNGATGISEISPITTVHLMYSEVLLCVEKGGPKRAGRDIFQRLGTIYLSPIGFRATFLRCTDEMGCTR